MKILLEDLLDKFRDWVSEKKVKRIPYDEWRVLTKIQDHYVSIEEDDWFLTYSLFDLTESRLISKWDINDGSFGTFLNELYIKWCDYEQSMKQLSSTISNTSTLASSLSTATNKIKDSISQLTINRKEDNNMNNLFKGFEFGSCENDNVKMSMYGIAVKNANNTWVSYDTNSGNVIDVDILNFNAKYLYKMPVAVKDIKESDVIIHNRRPMFVTKVEAGKILAIDPAAGEEKIILLTRSPFGFDFVTKIVNVFEGMGGEFKPTEDQPFGNPLMFMMLSDNANTSDLLPFIFMNSQETKFNPLMLLALCDKNDSDNLLPLLFLTQGFGQSK